MLLAYVDESYDAARYWIAALVCPAPVVVSLTSALDEIVVKAARGYEGISPLAELHGYDLFHGKRQWSALKTMVRARIGIYNDASRRWPSMTSR